MLCTVELHAARGYLNLLERLRPEYGTFLVCRHRELSTDLKPPGLSPSVKERRLLAACLATSAAAVLFSAYIHSSYSFNWIYSDIYSFWGRDWLVAGQVPYTQGSLLEYPPLAGAILYAARVLGGLSANAAGGLYAGYYDWFSIFSLAAALGIAWSTWRLAKALVSELNPLYFLLPSVLIYGVYNFDLFNALFIVLCLQTFVEKRRGWSAAFLGLAIATKLVAVVLIPVLLLEIGEWKERLNYLVVSALIALATAIPVLIYNFGFVSWFLSYFSGWGLEDAWYIWIFGSPFSFPAKLFGYGLMALLLLRVYTLKMPLIPRSLLALSVYLFATPIYAPQFNLILIPLVAALALTSPWLFSMEIFNALIILTWFSVPATPTGGPTYAWTLPQTMALLRSASLGLLGLAVASANGHSLIGWIRGRTSSQSTIDSFAGPTSVDETPA